MMFTIVECMRKGAYDYMTKELEYESMLLRVRNAMALAKLKKAYDQQIKKVVILEEQLSKCDQLKIKQYPTQEQNVLGLIRKGLAIKGITKDFHMELSGLKAHIRNGWQS